MIARATSTGWRVPAGSARWTSPS